MARTGSKSRSQADPTRAEYAALATAYDFFNMELFEGSLPHCLITLQRKHGMMGYFSPERFEGRDEAERTDEIALNPATFATSSDTDILSTLVHEQVHLWQQHFGQPGRGRYHNGEWADKMEALGLMPSNTGKPGGKRTGQRMTHFVIEGGRFDLACKKLLATGFRINWQSRETESGGGGSPKKDPSKIKFTCPVCGLNAWAKTGAAIRCGNDGTQLQAEDGSTPALPESPGSDGAATPAGPRPDLESAVSSWFRKMSKRWHPDTGGTDQTMQAINDAHEALLQSLGIRSH